MYPAAMAGELVALLPRLHGRRRPTRSAPALRSSPRRPRTSCPSRCAASRSSASSCCYAGPVEEGVEALPAAARARPTSASTWSSRCPTSRCSSCSTSRTRRACRTTGPPTSSHELPDEAIDVLVAHATKPGVTADADHRRAGRRRDRPRGRGRHRVRSARRAVEHPLPVDVARSRRHRHEHRLHARDLPRR